MRLGRVMVAIVAVGLLLSAPVRAAAQDTRPNIVFVLTDDLSTDLIRHMPAVRRLQRDGVSASRFIVDSSLCCPSRSSILTGKLPHNTKVLSNFYPLGGYARFMEAGNARSTFASSLQAAGYRTALFGKFLNGYDPRTNTPLPGFDEWLATGGAGAYDGYGYTLNDNGIPRYFTSEFINVTLADRARAFIDTWAGRQPFVLEVATTTPHAPFAWASRDDGRFTHLKVPRRGAYDQPVVNPPGWLRYRPPLTPGKRRHLDEVLRRRVRAVQSVNRLVAALRKRLRERGVEGSTYFVFSSDNGLHIGQHRLTPGKRTAFDTDIRVPLVVAGPGLPAGRTTGVLAQNTDLRPTFEAMAGLDPSPDVDGIDLLPHLQDPFAAGGRGAALVEYSNDAPSPGVGDADSQSRAAGLPPDYTALRLPDATYVEDADGDREYYDLARDPHQRVNRYAALSPAQRASLAARLAALRACRGAAQCAAP
jgi:arylsulfatase A-like enzyme